MNKIVIFNQYYKPLNNPPAKRLSAFAEYFALKGCDVNIITGMPNYPNGKLYNNYKSIYKKEVINNVKVYRFFEVPLEIKGALKPLINYISFAISSLFSLPILLKSNVIILSSPPIFSIYLPYTIALLLRKRIILDIRDLWPDSLVGLGYMNNKSLIFKIISKLNTFLFNNSDLVTTVSKKLKHNISLISKAKIEVITNFAKSNKIKIQTNKISILYIGRLTEVYNILDYINVIRNFPFISLHIVGDGDLKGTIQDLKYDNIKYYGYLNKDEYLKIASNCNICLIPAKDIQINKDSFSSKSFEYLSFGLPILFNTLTELKELNEEYNFGWYVDNPTSENIQKVIESITFEDIAIKSENAHKLFLEKFEESIVCDKLYKLVESLI